MPDDAAVRRTISASARYWAVLDQLVEDRAATSVSDAFRYVCDKFIRWEDERLLVDAAGDLDDDAWLAEAGQGATDASPTKWAALSSGSD